MGTETLSAQHVGRIVRVRQRQYLVDDVSPGKTASSTIARLSCIDPDQLGRPLEVIWEQELDAEIPAAESWGLLGGWASILPTGSRPTATRSAGTG